MTCVDSTSTHSSNSVGDTSLQPGSFYQVVATPHPIQDQSWYMDSGALNHMVADASNLTLKSPYPGGSKVQVGNKESIPITYTGMLMVSSFDTNRLIHLRDILCVPQIAKNLLSMSQITKDNNVIFEFHSDHCLVKDKNNKDVLLQGTVNNGLYQFELTKAINPSVKSISCSTAPAVAILPFISKVPFGVHFPLNTKAVTAFPTTVSSSNKCLSNNANSDLLLLWHARLGHPNSRTLHVVLNKLNVKQSLSSNKSFFCEACQYGKLQQCHFPMSESRAKASLEIIHSDLWGPAPINSCKGYKYYITFVDDFSKFTWIYPLKLKSKAYAAFVQFHCFVERQWILK